ncbi:DUF1697 domain-containing protein [Aeromicrobium sp.]|uniref:DUF1697 domain-containing protein n=1 Tax=Aeromicrobium sp. TaxID=1871063 RepID=UPI003D6AD90D
MSVHVVLLRAVNVGGAKLPMAELRELAADLGATDVSTFIASGNLICDPPQDVKGFGTALEKAIEKKYGFFRECIMRTPAELATARTNYPFEVDDPKNGHITFLLGRPTKAAIEKARGLETGADAWEVIGCEWHIRYDHGAGRSDMKTPAIAKALGVPGTSRNLRTVEKLIELATD